MITFVHKKHADKARGKGKLVITYTGFEIILGLLLLFTNISAMIMIYNYGIHKTVPFKGPLLMDSMSVKSNTKR